MSKKLKEIVIKINGREVKKQIEPRILLSELLREEMNLTGTHIGCEHGVCGACTVKMDGRAVRSCLVFALQANGADVETVESLASDDGSLHPLQQAFYDNHALQCGFCTPGFLMSLVCDLEKNPSPSDEEIREMISGNICRCTGYTNIIKAVKQYITHHTVDKINEKKPQVTTS